MLPKMAPLLVLVWPPILSSNKYLAAHGPFAQLLIAHDLLPHLLFLSSYLPLLTTYFFLDFCITWVYQ